jgi:PAS domain S-box-containing protein
LHRLREFGLSEYAARAYLALLDLGVAEARDVSTLSKVPQAKIYHVLEQLHEKGLAVILPEFPKKYAPVPFPEYLDRLHDEHARAADAIARDREVLADMFRVLGDTDVGNRGFFTVIRGRRNVMAKLVEMLQGAKSDLLVVGTTGFASRQEPLRAPMEEAKARGVRMRALLPLTPETMPRIAGALEPLLEIRARDIDEGQPSGGQSSRVAIVVADAARAFLINFLPDDDNVYTGKDVGVFTDQEAMVAALQALVEPHWATAADIASRREQLATGRPPEITRAYATGAEGIAALSEAAANGRLREVRAIDSRAASAPGEVGGPLLEPFRAAGARLRAVLNVGDVETARALDALVESWPGAEIRHATLRVPARYWCLDDREAFVSLPSDASDEIGVLVHTTTPAVVRSLRGQFDDIWARAMPLGKRLEELEVFPHLQPRDIGLGRLFQDVRDPILVADVTGRIILWNRAATARFGHEVAEALRLRLADVLPDAAVRLREAVGGVDVELPLAAGVGKDGARFAAAMKLHPVRDASSGVTYALVIVQAEPAPRKLDVRVDGLASPQREP